MSARAAFDPNMVPDAEEMWVRLGRFMSQWGSVAETARGWSLTWGENDWVTEVEITREELHAYTYEHVRWRFEHGLDDGLGPNLGDGRELRLPLGLMDSFGECFGPQLEPYGRMKLEGLVFKVIPDAVP
jgi:hypothetical protein